MYFIAGKIYDVTFGKLHCTIGCPEVNSDIYNIPSFNSIDELNAIFLDDCKFELVNEEYVEKECPFCKTKIESGLLINTICPKCNAKYYFQNGKWQKDNHIKPLIDYIIEKEKKL
ncbi:MAG: hypothetical protein PHT02_01140 [Tissierellia bacterium]|nr:hypothetical protein [Tissierellia bacterium]